MMDGMSCASSGISIISRRVRGKLLWAAMAWQRDAQPARGGDGEGEAGSGSGWEEADDEGGQGAAQGTTPGAAASSAREVERPSSMPMDGESLRVAAPCGVVSLGKMRVFARRSDETRRGQRVAGPEQHQRRPIQRVEDLLGGFRLLQRLRAACQRDASAVGSQE